jgi:hypothetical protein
MKKWEAHLAEVLEDGMRYCFKTVNGKYPELDKEAFYGLNNSSGFFDLVSSTLCSELKDMFFKGYSIGVSDALHDLSEATGNKFDFDSDINKQGAWKAWEVVNK